MESYDKERYEEAMTALEARYPWDCPEHDKPWWRWLTRIRDYVRKLEEENTLVSQHSKNLIMDLEQERKKVRELNDELDTVARQIGKEG